MKTMTKTERIISWNKSRNGLEFDPNLEVRLLSEEASEFYLANSYGHKLQEYADFLFVWEGTKAKFNATTYKSHVNFVKASRFFEEVKRWVNSLKTDMHNILLTMEPRKAQDDIEFAILAVIKANENKPNKKDKGGKIVKGENYISPLEVINTYLKGVPDVE